MKRYIKASVEKPYLYIFKHGIGPGTLPSDVVVVKTKDLPRGYTAVWTDRFLTTNEMDQYDIPYETEINRYLNRIGYCQRDGDVVPCDEVEACGKIAASSVSAKSRNVTKEVLESIKGTEPELYNELVEKDIWINLWPDGEYSLSYSLLKPEYYLTETASDRLIDVMSKLFPDSYWGDAVEACDSITGASEITDDQVKFFYKGKFLGSCDPEYIECPKLLELMKSDRDAATQVLAYMNSLGDPVFPVSEEDWDVPETNINNIDIDDLYNTFMQELQYNYADLSDSDTFMVGLDYVMPDFEIFTGAVAEDVDLSATTKYKADMVNCSEDEEEC